MCIIRFGSVPPEQRYPLFLCRVCRAALGQNQHSPFGRCLSWEPTSRTWMPLQHPLSGCRGLLLTDPSMTPDCTKMGGCQAEVCQGEREKRPSSRAAQRAAFPSLRNELECGYANETDTPLPSGLGHHLPGRVRRAEACCCRQSGYNRSLLRFSHARQVPLGFLLRRLRHAERG